MGIEFILFIVINILNFASVKVYGEAEFWFSIIKVAAIVAMILFGSYLLFSGTGGEQASIHNLYNDGGFFPKGFLAKELMEIFKDYSPPWHLLCSLLGDWN